jgi:hypothetical protein
MVESKILPRIVLIFFSGFLSHFLSRRRGTDRINFVKVLHHSFSPTRSRHILTAPRNSTKVMYSHSEISAFDAFSHLPRACHRSLCLELLHLTRLGGTLDQDLTPTGQPLPSSECCEMLSPRHGFDPNQNPTQRGESSPRR